MRLLNFTRMRSRSFVVSFFANNRVANCKQIKSMPSVSVVAWRYDNYKGLASEMKNKKAIWTICNSRSTWAIRFVWLPPTFLARRLWSWIIVYNWASTISLIVDQFHYCSKFWTGQNRLSYCSIRYQSWTCLNSVFNNRISRLFSFSLLCSPDEMFIYNHFLCVFV